MLGHPLLRLAASCRVGLRQSLAPLFWSWASVSPPLKWGSLEPVSCGHQWSSSRAGAELRRWIQGLLSLASRRCLGDRLGVSAWREGSQCPVSVPPSRSAGWVLRDQRVTGCLDQVTSASSLLESKQKASHVEAGRMLLPEGASPPHAHAALHTCCPAPDLARRPH